MKRVMILICIFFTYQFSNGNEKAFDKKIVVKKTGSKTKSADFKSLRKSKIQSLKDILSSARMEPQRDSKGKLTNFVISDVKPGSSFAKIGFHKGDVITSINGKKIKKPGDSAKIFGEIGKGNKPEVIVIRDGKSLVLKEAD